jgi:enamine deaminase RidA (YjgF/YER057c/UK114 family)
MSDVPSLVEYLNPETLNRNPAFTNVVVVTGPVKTIYIGGQDAVDAAGRIVGKGDIRAQTEQVFKNLQAALEAAGASLENVVKWNLLIMQGQPLPAGFEVFQRVWGRRPNPPTITFMYVAGLANPDFLIEMDAIAVIP